MESLISSYVSGNFITTSFPKFIEALILGDYEVYRFGDTSEIYPLFRVSSDNVCSPLLKIRILALLKAIQIGNKKIEDKHLTVSSIVSYFESMGGEEYSVESCLKELNGLNLIEPYDLSINGLSNDQRFAITYRGSSHLNLSIKNSVYFYQMALTTPINCEETSLRIKSIYKDSVIRFYDKIYSIRRFFSDYLISEDAKYYSIKVDDAKYNNQNELLANIVNFRNAKNQDDEPSNTFGESYKPGVVEKGVDAIVDSFDVSINKGYAFVDGYDEALEVTTELLEKFNISEIHDGDSIRCDLSRKSSGLYIERIYFATERDDDYPIEDCIITKYFPLRGYGFCRFGKNSNDAFFHKTVFNKSTATNLASGYEFKAEIISSAKNSYQVRRVID